MSLELILAQNLGVMQKLIFLCSIIFVLILVFKIWRHLTIIITLICGTIVTISASFHATADVSFIIIGWWALPLGYFMVYKGFNELLKIDGGLPNEVKTLWLVGLLAPSWLLFSIFGGYLLLLLISPLILIFPTLDTPIFSSTLLGLIAPIIFIYLFYIVFVTSKLDSFEERVYIRSPTYQALLVAVFLSIVVLGFEVYSAFILGIGG